YILRFLYFSSWPLLRGNTITGRRATQLSGIPSLISRLKRYPDDCFEVIGHVNYQSKRDQQFLKDLFVLSTKRAELVTQILTENGIPQNRLSHKDVGNTQPLISNPKTNDERRKNMPVLIKVFSRRSWIFSSAF
ncbi:MAG: hypothetical protein EOO01_04005, partial [Chitinophagaceae bacterium]